MVKDVVDPVLDERLAEFVVSSHMRAHPDAQEADEPTATAIDRDVLPQDMLRKYVTYAKQTCRPKLQNADYDKIATVRLMSILPHEGTSFGVDFFRAALCNGVLGFVWHAVRKAYVVVKVCICMSGRIHISCQQ